MSSQFKHGGASNGGHSPNMPLMPGLALIMWNPFVTGDGEGFGAFGTIAREWQDFVGRRLKEDMDLVHRLARCTAPDQVLSAYTDFWRKAGEDYGREITTMTDLMTDMADKMTAAAQSSTEAARAPMYQRRAA